MKRLLILFSFLFLTLPIALVGQSTTVSGTLVDSHGTVWSNAKILITFYQTPNTPGPFIWSGGPYNAGPITVTTDGSGVFSTSLPSNTSIVPAGSQWQFSIAPNASSNSINMLVPVTGATLDVSSMFTDATSSQTVQVVQSMPLPRAYSDATVKVPPNAGQCYYNTTTNTTRCWNGTGWTSQSGGSGNVVGQLNRVGSFSDSSTTKATNATVDSAGNQFTFPSITVNNNGQPFTFNQVCTDTTQVIPGRPNNYLCNLWTGSNIQAPNQGQVGNGYVQLQSTYNLLQPGMNPGTNGSINSFQESVGGGPWFITNTYQRGNHSGFTSTLNAYGGGDTQGMNVNVTAYANASAGADEGTEGHRVTVTQIGPLAGTLVSGGTFGSTRLNTNNSGPFYDQGYVYDNNVTVGTATISSIPTVNNTLNALTQTVSGLTMTPSTAWGKMDPASVTYATGPVGIYQNEVSATANITLGTSPASPGPFVVGSMTCAGAQIEYMKITAVGTPSGGVQSVTFNTRNGWDNSHGNTNQAACFQGGSMDGVGFVDTSLLATTPALYPILGATDASTMIFANCVAGVCTGQSTGNTLLFGANITLFKYAEVIGTAGTNGVALLGYNTNNWVNGHAIIEPIATQGLISGFHINMAQKSPLHANQVGIQGVNQSGSTGVNVNDTGTVPIKSSFHASNGKSVGNPPVNLPLAVLTAQGTYQNDMIFQADPASGGCIICTLGVPGGEGSSFTGSISGGVLTVTAVASGFILPGQELQGSGVPVPCEVGPMTAGTGFPGGVGQYAIQNCGNPTIGSQTMTTTYGNFDIFRIGAFAGASNVTLTYNSTTKALTLYDANGAGAFSLQASSATMPDIKGRNYGLTTSVNSDSAFQVALTSGVFTYTTGSVYLNHPICSAPSYLGSQAGATTTGFFGYNWVGANGGTNTTPNSPAGAWTLTATGTTGANATVNVVCMTRP